VSTIWENALPGDSAREVVTDAAAVITDVVGGAVTVVVGPLEFATAIETGATAFCATALGLVGGDAVGPVVAPKAAAVRAPERTNAIRRWGTLR
jgi:hypothetical protein